MSMIKISLGRYISLLLFFSLLLTPVRTYGVGWMPSDAGMIVNMEQGERFLLSVVIDGKEYFVSNYNRYDRPDDIFKYKAGAYLKLLPQEAGTTEPSEMSVWTVGAPLARGDKALGAVVYTIWNDGKTLRTQLVKDDGTPGGDHDFKFFGTLTDNYGFKDACDVVFIIPTNRGVPTVDKRTVPSFDPANTLGKGTAPFD